jgi:hypothetical protein
LRALLPRWQKRSRAKLLNAFQLGVIDRWLYPNSN